MVPYQQTPWVIHNSNFVKQSHYDEGRKICLREYPEFFYAKGGFDFSFNEEWEQLSDMLAAEVQNLIEQSHWSEVAEIIAAYRNGKQKSSQLEILAILSDIFQSEKKANVKNSFFSEVDTYESIITKYMNLCFLLRRIELNFDAPAYADLETMIRSNTISYETIISILLHCIVDQKAVIIKLITFYSESNQVQNVAKAQAVYEYLKDRSIPIAYSQSRPNS